MELGGRCRVHTRARSIRAELYATPDLEIIQSTQCSWSFPAAPAGEAFVLVKSRPCTSISATPLHGEIPMRSTRLIPFSIMFVVGFSLCSTLLFAGETTAKSGLAQAQESARKWQADAALVQIITVSGNMEGSAEKWGFLFHSPQAKKGYKVDVKDSKIDQTLEVSSSFTDSVDGDFIDSPQAMAEGKKKGLKGKSRAMMTLHIMLQGTKSQGAYWNIVSDMAEGRSTLINAKTGKFFRHQPLK